MTSWEWVVKVLRMRLCKTVGLSPTWLGGDGLRALPGEGKLQWSKWTGKVKGICHMNGCYIPP